MSLRTIREAQRCTSAGRQESLNSLEMVTRGTALRGTDRVRVRGQTAKGRGSIWCTEGCWNRTGQEERMEGRSHWVLKYSARLELLVVLVYILLMCVCVWGGCILIM